MWRNYLTVGLRALAKNKTYTFINVLGLAIGMAACLLILLYVRFETSFDEWLPNNDRVYAIHFAGAPPGQEKQHVQMAPYPVAHAFKKDFPQVEAAVSTFQARPVVRRAADSLFVDDTLIADPSFFQVLELPFIHGDRNRALTEAASVVLSREEARRLLGREDVLGQTVTIVHRGQQRDYRVTGVMDDIPDNSSLKIGMVMRFEPADYADNPQALDSYGNINGYGWIKLRPGASIEDVRRGMPAFEARNMPPQDIGNGQKISIADLIDLNPVNIRDVHLGQAQNASMTPGNDARTVTTFTVVAALILAMACVNFTNLATARASQRAREVALRKVLGAGRRQLIVQFVGESVLVSAFAMLLALAFTELLLPVLSSFLEAEMDLAYVGEDGVLGLAALLVLIVGVIGGLYPAFYLSRFQPAKILKANKSSADAHGSGWLRNMLVVGQFAVSIGLIICTAIVYAQTVHARSADPGYKREGLLVVEGLNRRQINAATAATLRERVARLDGVAGASRSSLTPAQQDQSNTAFQVPGRPDPELVGIYPMDPHHIDVMQMSLLAGRGFSDTVALDLTDPPQSPDPVAERALAQRGGNMIVNESAARKFGFATPQEAIGKVIGAGMINAENGGFVPMTIVGVLRDAQFRSVRDQVEPSAYVYSPTGMRSLVVRYETSDPIALRGEIEKVWRELVPDVPFEAEFAEDSVAELYAADEARGRVFAAFAVVSIIVGCLGLFGLAAFTTERRTKEIGIRKVLGARTQDIIRLLVWQFSKPVVIANLVAWPIAWWVMRDWLNGFADRVSLHPGWFVGAGILAMLIAATTIIGHAVKVARANPILALRYE